MKKYSAIVVVFALVFAIGLWVAAAGGDEPGESVTPASPERLPKIYLDKNIKGELLFSGWRWRKDIKEGGWVITSTMTIQVPTYNVSSNQNLRYVLFDSSRKIIKAGVAFSFSARETRLREKDIIIAVPLPGYIAPGDVASVDFTLE